MHVKLRRARATSEFLAAGGVSTYHLPMGYSFFYTFAYAIIVGQLCRDGSDCGSLNQIAVIFSFLSTLRFIFKLYDSLTIDF